MNISKENLRMVNFENDVVEWPVHTEINKTKCSPIAYL